jgi:hypothetical protein
VSTLLPIAVIIIGLVIAYIGLKNSQGNAANLIKGTHLP